jgi:hypothetical protein
VVSPWRSPKSAFPWELGKQAERNHYACLAAAHSLREHKGRLFGLGREEAKTKFQKQAHPAGDVIGGEELAGGFGIRGSSRHSVDQVIDLRGGVFTPDVIVNFAGVADG